MIRFSAIVSVVAVALGLLVVGAVSGVLVFVYLAIGLASAALLMLIAGVFIWRDEIFGPTAADRPDGIADDTQAAARAGGGLVGAPVRGAPAATYAIPGAGQDGGRGTNGRARPEPGPRAGAGRAENGGFAPAPGNGPYHDLPAGERNGGAPAVAGRRGDQLGPSDLARPGRGPGRRRDRGRDSARAGQPAANRVDPIGPRPVPDVLPGQAAVPPADQGGGAGWFRPAETRGPATVANGGAGAPAAAGPRARTAEEAPQPARPANAGPAAEPPPPAHLPGRAMAPKPGPGVTPQPAATGAADAAAEGTAAVGTVIVVPGIARYHKADCILIRFLGEDDLEAMSQAKAEESGCVPCRACRPEKG